jgi:uncharacterized membrane protein
MNRWRLALIRLLEAFWLGSAIFLMAVAAPAAFRAAGGPSSAADVVGAMLNRWHYIALAVPVVLLLLNLRAGRGSIVALLTIATFAAASQGMIDLKAQMIRAASVVPISSLAANDPTRRSFMMLHGLSMGVLLLQVILAILIVTLGALTSWREQLGLPAAPVVPMPRVDSADDVEHPVPHAIDDVER